MSLFSVSCPHCKHSNRHQSGSSGTLKTCAWCKQQYVVPEPSALGCVPILAISFVVVIGIIFIAVNTSSKPNNHIAKQTPSLIKQTSTKRESIQPKPKSLPEPVIIIPQPDEEPEPKPDPKPVIKKTRVVITPIPSPRGVREMGSNNDISQFDRFGKPSSDKVKDGKRRIVFDEEKVVLSFVSDRFAHWKFVGYSDLDDISISVDEATARMSKRDTKGKIEIEKPVIVPKKESRIIPGNQDVPQSGFSVPSNKSVHVQDMRKGVYVAPHMRSAPSRSRGR